MSKPIKILVAISAIPILILLYFVPNIYGYYRFKHYCEKEGGLRVFEPLEKNVGWLAKDKYDTRAASQLKYVGFVRYTDKDNGKTYDLRYVGKNPQHDSSFKTLLADESKKVVYEWKSINEKIEDETRLMRYGEKILNTENGSVSAQYLMFGYEKFNRSHTPLDMPSEIDCFNDPASETSSWLKALNTAFKN